jgi:hypothetical protein
MMVSRELLREAVSELVRLKTATEDPTRFLAQLYDSALSEWAGRLQVDRLKLDKLVSIKGSISIHRLH